MSVVKEAEDYNATEGLSFAEIKAYLEELHVWRDVDLYESDHFDAREKELQAQMALHYLVRIVGVDEATFRRYLCYGEEQGKLARSGARAEDLGILVGAERAPYEENTFPLMIQGELKELPLALILLPGEHEEMLRSEYLKTAAQAGSCLGFLQYGGGQYPLCAHGHL